MTLDQKRLEMLMYQASPVQGLGSGQSRGSYARSLVITGLEIMVYLQDGVTQVDEYLYRVIFTRHLPLPVHLDVVIDHFNDFRGGENH